MSVESDVCAVSPQPPPVDEAAVHRNTMRTLLLTQALVGFGTVSTVSVATLVAEDLLGSERWSGLAGASFTLGSALAAIVLARLTAKSTRRRSLRIAWTAGCVGLIIAVLGVRSSFAPVYFLGMLIAGSANAGGLQSRYAAADLSRPGRAGSDVAWLIWMSSIGALLAPRLVPSLRHLADRLSLDDLVGPMLGGLLAFLIAAVVVSAFLRPDPLEVRRSLDPGATATATAIGGAGGQGRPAKVTLRESWAVASAIPLVRVAMLCLPLAQAVMVAVMTMTPVHVHDGNGSAQLITQIISLHVVGMYGLSPVWGRLVDRVGAAQVMFAGAMTLALSCALAAAAAATNHGLLFVALTMLGVGWSLTIVAASSVVASRTPESHRVAIQGLSDFMMSGVGAIAAVGSGLIMSAAGYPVLSMTSLALAAVAMGVVMRLTIGPPGSAASGGGFEPALAEQA